MQQAALVFDLDGTLVEPASNRVFSPLKQRENVWP
jgi:phosphoglycolate phosphatase-like HAD superfamily hydrolase